jgi:predicted nicotinamide N-methyase
MDAMADQPDPHAAFIRAHSRLRPVPHVPEVRLHLADDAIRLWEETEGELGLTDQPPPYWAFAWPGGQALARYLLDHADLILGRAVLDLGAGSGLTAIAAALAGASAVLASDPDPFAVAAIELNAHANGVAIATAADVLDGTGEDAEVLLAADIWYEQRLAERATGLLTRASARGASVLVADVGRAFLPRTQLREVDAYDVPVVADLEDAPVKRVMILTLA